MNLDVDLGNTRIKWRIGAAGAVQAAPIEAWRDVVQCLPEQFRQIRVCNVLGAELEKSFAAACHARWQITPRFASVVERKHRLQIKYEDPATLGVDRWLAMLAAVEQYPGLDLMVISGGTAVTVDLVGMDGVHAGGLILPGLGMASRALFTAAPGLPCDPVRVDSIWQPGQTTKTCINAGFSALYQGLFVVLLQQRSRPFSADTAIFTGGDGRDLMHLCPASVDKIFQPELVLDGLASALSDR